MELVKRYLSGQSPRLLEAAVLFKKPWSRVNAEYCLEVVDKWVVFPYELNEVNRLRIARGEVPEGKR
jgi:hypothetical protein